MPATKTAPVKVRKSAAPSDAEYIEAANQFLAHKAAKSAAEKLYEKAKGKLKDFLGGELVKYLSDGRAVQRVVTEVAAELEPRKATQRESIVVNQPATTA